MVAQQENEARGAKVTPEIEAAARDDVESQLGLDAFQGFPASFQKRLVDQNAQIFTLRRQRRRFGARRRSTPEGLRRRPLAVRRGVRQPHPREHAGGSRRRREARSPTARTSGRSPKEVSIDSGSAPNGGDLGCIAAGVTVKEFEDALFATPVGTVSKPVQTQFGYHVIKVTDKKAPAFDDAKPQVLQKILSDSNDKFNDVLNGSLTKAKVTIDPRFGTWNTVAATRSCRPTSPNLQNSTATTAATSGAPTTGG